MIEKNARTGKKVVRLAVICHLQEYCCFVDRIGTAWLKETGLVCRQTSGVAKHSLEQAFYNFRSRSIKRITPRRLSFPTLMLSNVSTSCSNESPTDWMTLQK
jgi:hypothetical protein